MLVVEAKRVVERRDTATLLHQLNAAADEHPGSRGVVVSRYLSPPVRKRLSDAGLSYIDATGNITLNVSQPGLYIADRGADHDPWRGPGRPRSSDLGPRFSMPWPQTMAGRTERRAVAATTA
ncbi:hypothetical protein [Nonomuraea helvata]|uniref:Uncharacterized protein n=1 Tax=Nonomuraea helvata TaxID=37484 RepID=A0ABV5SCM6_9ACTN